MIYSWLRKYIVCARFELNWIVFLEYFVLGLKIILEKSRIKYLSQMKNALKIQKNRAKIREAFWNMNPIKYLEIMKIHFRALNN